MEPFSTSSSSSYQQYHNHLLDSSSFFIPNNTTPPPIKLSPSSLLHPHQHHMINTTTAHYYPPLINQQETSSLDTSSLDQTYSKVAATTIPYNSTSPDPSPPFLTQINHSPESSSVVENGEQVTQNMDNKRKITSKASSFNNNKEVSAGGREGRSSKKQKKGNNGGSGVMKKGEKEKEEAPTATGYIHVRARRGQATDSHSLAERVRREKISERMKMLQRLVPGCDKVTGKALVLDEIINYVQSLQNQVEFLSMKLASLSPFFFDFAMDIDSNAHLVRPLDQNVQNQKITNIASSAPTLASIPQCSKNQATPFADTTTMTTTTTTTTFPGANNNNNSDYLMDYSSSPVFEQGQRTSNVFSEYTGGQFWEVEEDQRQKLLLHSYGLGSNNLGGAWRDQVGIRDIVGVGHGGQRDMEGFRFLSLTGLLLTYSPIHRPQRQKKSVPFSVTLYLSDTSTDSIPLTPSSLCQSPSPRPLLLTLSPPPLSRSVPNLQFHPAASELLRLTIASSRVLLYSLARRPSADSLRKSAEFNEGSAIGLDARSDLWICSHFRLHQWNLSILCMYVCISRRYQLTDEDTEALLSLHDTFEKCVSANGLGLKAAKGSDYCQTTINFPSDTIPKWKDPKTGELESLSFDFNLCEAVATWEQVRNSTTILTKEFIDSLPNGWEEYAWRRINKGILLNRCQNKTLCMEKLSLEIDDYDVVIRENGAPIENYTEYVGRKSTFRLLNRGSAKALDKVVELDEQRKEALIIKTTIHDIMNQMIRELPIKNPVYLMLGASFGSAAKGTGLKALEFALSMCDSVDMYGFTVDPGYKEWTRYFSESRQGHTPLHGRAYYQMMECLGLIKIHSPMRADPNRVVKWVPSYHMIRDVRIASEKLLGRVGAGSVNPLSACSIIKRQVKRNPDTISKLRKAAQDHMRYVKSSTMYPLEHNPGHGLLCTVPAAK
ncbi:hypothetical protein PIB30_055565 [Stylosanthes scabra]|uniref:BHLH domain-containing protein n=1 Tax=Stylosanthes scabra TaxID=79078 RepID=A0ABU6ZHS2_9FABA|nr:hypothetical protein [Stylosanthes scabra]